MTQPSADTSIEFAELIYSIIDTWRSRDPAARDMPNEVRRQINLAVREDNRRQSVEYQRTRTNIEAAVRDHQHNMLVGYRPRVAESYDTWFTRQQQLGKQRLAIEQAINAEPRLTTEDRGQAVVALSVAHHAPSTPALPVFTPHPPTGLQALRARVQAKLAQLRAGLVSDKERRRVETWEQVHRERREQAQRLAGPEAASVLDASRALGLYDDGVWLSRDTHTHQQTQLGDLETTVQQLRADKDQLAQTVTELTARIDELTQSTTEQAASDQAVSVIPIVGVAEAENVPTASKPAATQPQAQPSESDEITAALIGVAHPNVATPQPNQAGPTPAAAEGHDVAAAPSVGDDIDI